MTDLAVAPLRTRLRTIDAARAGLQSRLIEALNRRVAGEYLLEARTAADETASAWIMLDADGQGEVGIAPLLAAGAIPSLSDGTGRLDAALAAVALGAIEPIVAAAELTIGRALRPTTVAGSDREDAVRIVIEAWQNGACVHRALISLGSDLRIAPGAPLPFAGGSAIVLAPRWTATIAGPGLSPSRFAAMARGDLLLLGTGGNVARFTPPGRMMALIATLNMQQGVMTVEQGIGDQEIGEAPHVVESAPQDPESEPGEIRIPTSIEFDGGGLSLERLDALGVGSVVTIPAAAGGVLPVRVIAGGTRVASGELVAVGDGFGVLITAIARQQSEARPQSETQPQAQPQPVEG